ncbi:MAG: hypothetical protein ACYC9L_16810 [Sulfuricaulis sp.]
MDRLEEAKKVYAPATKKRLNEVEKYGHRAAEYEAYKIWRIIPAQLRGAPETYIAAAGMDAVYQKELLSIRTQTEFSKKYKVSKQTLTAWNKKLDEDPDTRRFRNRVKNLLPTAFMAFYAKLLKEGNAERFVAFLKFIGEGDPPQGPQVIVPIQVIGGEGPDRLLDAIKRTHGPEYLETALALGSPDSGKDA